MAQLIWESKRTISTAVLNSTRLGIVHLAVTKSIGGAHWEAKLENMSIVKVATKEEAMQAAQDYIDNLNIN